MYEYVEKKNLLEFAFVSEVPEVLRKSQEAAKVSRENIISCLSTFYSKRDKFVI
jgi:hypothetical protein